MKDNMQNIVDLIGALAEDIEEIKKKLEAKDTSDKDEAVKRPAAHCTGNEAARHAEQPQQDPFHGRAFPGVHAACSHKGH